VLAVKSEESELLLREIEDLEQRKMALRREIHCLKKKAVGAPEAIAELQRQVDLEQVAVVVGIAN
jgi:hypothetical protein